MAQCLKCGKEYNYSTHIPNCPHTQRETIEADLLDPIDQLELMDAFDNEIDDVLLDDITSPDDINDL